MGQAKNRGSYQERKENAIADNLLTVKLLQQQEEQWYNSLSSEERIAVKIKRAKDAKICASLGNVEAVQYIVNGIPFQN